VRTLSARAELKILHRPETLDEIVHHIDIEQERSPQCRDLPGIGLNQENA
jgi:hypothetical protein